MANVSLPVRPGVTSIEVNAALSAEVRREMRARLFTIAIIPEPGGDSFRGSIMVEKGTIEGSQSPRVRHFLSCKFPGIFLIGRQ